METAGQRIREHLQHWLRDNPNEPMPEMEVEFIVGKATLIESRGKQEALYLHLLTKPPHTFGSAYRFADRLQVAPPPVGKKLKDRPAYYTEMAKRIFTKLKLEALPSLKLEL